MPWQVYFRPVVKVHPATGRPNLQIGRHAFGAAEALPSSSTDSGGGGSEAFAMLAPEDSDAVLDELLRFATTSDAAWTCVARRAFVMRRAVRSAACAHASLDSTIPACRYYHQYEVGDLVCWDNRRLLHKACPYPVSQPRIMHGNRVAGEPATEAAIEVPPHERAAVLEAELRRIASNPALVEREMAVRARL